ncbi:hypothetical protein TTHERM_00016530 (macronuclear) [Tetrahymena thermophila SB210]|uniref:Ribosomal RNA-processing protein 42 n=1 Tax=Tetrahymena thermophila (strain SB210) TaxID=312017 RepID=Q22RD5_TETTS|nr:hypothetical protein TTHERM_00016530 [Tetrahymena thermophila SB210]EAR88187.2 hypothetical protein TTHERM_00016530 [Tetrahymena thermophila SB210]|eukprot:XP_001008432.2 hypothetical protein TTHERM_00016530 [Tetrahymena thermophila SB210]
MNQAIYRELLPQEYIERFTKQSIREDGRQFEQIRSIKYLRKNEVSLLSMGQTLVMASTEIKQYEDKQVNQLVTSQKYLIEAEAKLNSGQHGSSDVFSPIDIMKQESYYSQYIQNIINKNYQAIYAICQISKEIPNLYWEIKLNLRVVNNDGNLLDALLLAAQFELFNCQVNQTVVKTIDGALQLEIIEDKKKHLEFNIEDFLYPVQCSLFQNEVIIVDPSNFEQEYSEANIQVISSLNNKTQSINKLGARDIKFEALEVVSAKASQITQQRRQNLYELLTNHKQEFTL